MRQKSAPTGCDWFIGLVALLVLVLALLSASAAHAATGHALVNYPPAGDAPPCTLSGDRLDAFGWAVETRPQGVSVEQVRQLVCGTLKSVSVTGDPQYGFFFPVIQTWIVTREARLVNGVWHLNAGPIAGSGNTSVGRTAYVWSSVVIFWLIWLLWRHFDYDFMVVLPSTAVAVALYGVAVVAVVAGKTQLVSLYIFAAVLPFLTSVLRRRRRTRRIFT